MVLRQYDSIGIRNPKSEIINSIWFNIKKALFGAFFVSGVQGGRGGLERFVPYARRLSIVF